MKLQSIIVHLITGILLFAVGPNESAPEPSLNLGSLGSGQHLSVTQNVSGQATSRLLDKFCQIGKERAIESVKLDCKISVRGALDGQSTIKLNPLESQLVLRDTNLAEQCELVLESCCIGHHRNRNCDSGKQFAKSGAMCMDVELSKDVTVAAESFNDCCMSCSLGILAARNQVPGGTLEARCKLLSPLASSLSGQLYEQTYTECCLENLPRPSSALLDTGAPIDCNQANPCAQRCIQAGSQLDSADTTQDRCECFTGYKLAPDAINCLDVDECKLGLHTCNKSNEVCDNTRGGFRCLARRSSQLARAFIFDNDAFRGASSLGANHDRVLLPTSSQTEQTSSSIQRLANTEFISLRLCPIGTRWSSERSQCL